MKYYLLFPLLLIFLFSNTVFSESDDSIKNNVNIHSKHRQLELLEQLAAYRKIARTYRENKEYDKEISIYLKMLKINKENYAISPSNYIWQISLLRNYSYLIAAYRITGNEKEADEMKIMADRISEIVKKRFIPKFDPKDPSTHNQLLKNRKLANTYKKNKEYDKVILVYLNSLSINKKMAESQPKNRAWHLSLRDSYWDLNMIYKTTGEKEKEDEMKRMAVKINEVLKNNISLKHRSIFTSKIDPNHPSKNKQLVKNRKLANTYKKNKEYDKAILIYLNSLNINKKMTENQPKNKAWQLSLHDNYLDLIMIYKTIGDKEKEEKYFSKINKTIEYNDLKSKHSSKLSFDIDDPTKHGRLVIYKKLAHTYRKNKEYDKLIYIYLKMLKINKENVARNPSSYLWQRSLLHNYNGLLIVYGNTGDKEKKDEMDRMAVRVNEIVKNNGSLNIRGKLPYKVDPNHPSQNKQLVIYSKLANKYIKNKEYDKAILIYLKSLKINKEMAENKPKDNAWQVSLHNNYRDLSVMYKNTGDKEKEENANKETLKITKIIKDNHLKSIPSAKLSFDTNDPKVMSEIMKKFEEWKTENQKQAEEAIKFSDQDIQKKLAHMKGYEKNAESDSRYTFWVWKRNLAEDYKELGDMYKTRYRSGNNADKALKAYQKVLEIRKYLVERHNTVEWQYNVAISYTDLGDMYKKINDNRNALKAYQRGLKILEIVKKNIPNNPNKRQKKFSYLVDDALTVTYHMIKSIRKIDNKIEANAIPTKSQKTND